MKKSIIALCVLLSISNLQAQKSKVQTAWRALSDYESTLKDGKPDITYLNKGKEAIDLALTNPDTKNQGKAHAYKARIMYNFYSYALQLEKKKLESTVPNEKERLEMAYGTVPTNDLEAAQQVIDNLQNVDPKYLATIQEGFLGKNDLSEDDSKFVLAAAQIRMEAGNIANGKYKAKKYDEAADYFYKLANLNMTLSRKKDTANFYNACVCAARAKNMEKIVQYNTKMVDLNIATPYNFQAIYSAHINNKDTAAAMDILKKGREAFPNDVEILKSEVFLFLAKGKNQEALANINASLEKDPSNVLFYLVRGNIYDNMANPKDATGKDSQKPANYDDMVKNAESNYIKVIDLEPSNKEQMYTAYYSLGALYVNYSVHMQNKSNDLTLTELKTKGKEYDAKALENVKKAIPPLEKALLAKPDDLNTMMALRKLYNHVNDKTKANEMNEKIKAAGGK